MWKSALLGTLLCSVTSLAAVACGPLPQSPTELLLVGNKGENTVSFIDLATGDDVLRAPVSARAPHEIAVTPSGRFAAVVNYGDAVIDVFDVPFGSITASLDLGPNTRPHGLVATTDGGFVATTEGSDSIVILSPDHDFSQVGFGPCPTYDWSVTSIATGQDGTHMVALSPDESKAYTANMQSGTVSRIDLTTRDVRSVPAGTEVEGVAVTRDGRELWASVRGEDKVVVFDADTLDRKAEIAVGAFPLRIVASPDGRHMATSNLADGSITLIDVATRRVEATFDVSGSREAAQVTLLYSADGSRLYAAETGMNTIAEIDMETRTVIRRLAAGEQGDGLAIVPAR